MLTLALAQFRPRKGAYEENICRLGAVFREAAGWPSPPGLILAPEAALTGYFLEGGVRDLAVPAEKLFDDLARVHREAAGTAAGRGAGLLRGAPEPALQLGALRVARRLRRGHPARPPEDLPPDLRRVRRGALRRVGPRHRGVRHRVGPGGDPGLRGRLALDRADDRRARRRADRPDSEREPRTRHSARGRRQARQRAPLGAAGAGDRARSTGSTWRCRSWWASRGGRGSSAARSSRAPGATWSRGARCSTRRWSRPRSISRRSPAPARTRRCWPISR